MTRARRDRRADLVTALRAAASRLEASADAGSVDLGELSALVDELAQTLARRTADAALETAVATDAAAVLPDDAAEPRDPTEASRDAAATSRDGAAGPAAVDHASTPAPGAPRRLLHDLRSATGTILTWCYLLQRGMVDAEHAAHGIVVIANTVRRQLELIERLAAQTPKDHVDDAPTSAAATMPASAADTTAPAATADLSGVRIVIVDDDPDAREAMSAMLAAHGAEVATAISAIDAFDVLQQGRPDVLISDIVMPDADGYALLRRVRAPDTGERGLMPAIAVTGRGRAADRRRALAAGYQVQLTKPIDPAELVRAVRNLVGR